MLEAVGLPDVNWILSAYPHQLSGGMKQRAMIAMALLCDPVLLVADEPTTALDVTIQAQILALLSDLRRTFDLAVMLITHNLGVVAHTCERLAVLYAGRVVESGPTDAVFTRRIIPTRGPAGRHPYAGHARETARGHPGSVPADPGAFAAARLRRAVRSPSTAAWKELLRCVCWRQARPAPVFWTGRARWRHDGAGVPCVAIRPIGQLRRSTHPPSWKSAPSPSTSSFPAAG